jgi:hypothetical protein
VPDWTKRLKKDQKYDLSFALGAAGKALTPAEIDEFYQYRYCR